MPTSFTRFIGHVESNASSKSGTIFNNCTSLNETIVFGEKFVCLNSNNAFQNMGTEASPKNIVFLADMTGYVTTQNTKYVSFIFANKADTSPSDIGITHVYKNNNNKNSYMYFCYDDSKYNYSTENAEITDETEIKAYIADLLAAKTTEAKHFVNETVKTKPDCTTNIFATPYCFCGYDFEPTELEGTALGHDDVVIAIEYENYLANGTQTIGCKRCDKTETGVEALALIVFNGYSAKENNPNAICVAYTINHDMIAIYEKVAGKDLILGVVACASDNLVNQDNKPIKSNGLAAEVNKGKVVNNTIESTRKDVTVILETTDWSAYADKKMILCAYIIENGKVSYICNEEAVSDSGLTVTYNEIIGGKVQ